MGDTASERLLKDAREDNAAYNTADKRLALSSEELKADGQQGCLDVVRCLLCGWCCGRSGRSREEEKPVVSELKDLNRNVRAGRSGAAKQSEGALPREVDAVDSSASAACDSVPVSDAVCLRAGAAHGVLKAQALDRVDELASVEGARSIAGEVDSLHAREINSVPEQGGESSLTKAVGSTRKDRNPSRKSCELTCVKDEAPFRIGFDSQLANSCLADLRCLPENCDGEVINSSGRVTGRKTPEGSETDGSSCVANPKPLGLSVKGSLREASPSGMASQVMLDEYTGNVTELLCSSDRKHLYQLFSEPLLYTQSDLDEVVRVREEEWKKRYEDLNSRIKEEVAMRELLEQDNRDKVAAIRKENIEMKHVVEEYEKTIVQLTENSHHANLNTEATLAETLRAKEQLQQELHSTEANLVDAYKRVEKLKQVIDTYKQNEDLLKQSLNDFQDKLKRSEERYQALKKQAAEKVDAANVEINKVRKQKEVDLAGLEAALRMANSRISSLEQDVAQKVRANQELTSICDELIKKVSGET